MPSANEVAEYNARKSAQAAARKSKVSGANNALTHPHRAFGTKAKPPAKKRVIPDYVSKVPAKPVVKKAPVRRSIIGKLKHKSGDALRKIENNTVDKYPDNDKAYDKWYKKVTSS